MSRICSLFLELLSESYKNKEQILDTVFQLQEIDNALNKLKLKKTGDHSGITAEHLRYGGYSLKLWLLQVVNAIIEFEAIPDHLNLAIVTPVYKGSGKDPLDQGSYRGISVTPVITKLLELLILARLEPHLEELGVPHPNQSGYRKHTSCADAIFSTAELISHYLNQRENIYLCCYDLQKAFDSVEYGVLLCRLYDMGINAKLWRVIRKWYRGPQCQVQLDGTLSPSFSLQRGVRQGSVLSPILFLLVIDPLLQQMESIKLGPNFAGRFLGASAHADDIRTVTSSLHCLQRQVSLVQEFASLNGLQLNTKKCELMIASATRTVDTVLNTSMDSNKIETKHSVKCLGYWWSWDMSAKVAVEEGIKKARRAFFMHSSEVFGGLLNPLSGKAIFEICVLPVLLYGSENWVLNTSLLSKLEHFQGEIGRRILKFPRYHSTNSCTILLQWPSITARLLINKLCYILRLRALEGTGNMAASLFQASDSNNMSLVRECYFLDDQLGIGNYTKEVLKGEYDGCKKTLKNTIIEEDWKRSITIAKCSPSATFVADIATSTSWPSIWDLMLDRGPKATAAMQAFLRIATQPSIEGVSACPKCQEATSTTFTHFVGVHLHTSTQDIKGTLVSKNLEDIFSLIKQLRITSSRSPFTRYIP